MTRYVIVFPSMNTVPGTEAGKYTMHYIEHRMDPFGLTSDYMLKNATVFDKFEEAREVERILNENSGHGILTTIMKVY